MKKHLTIAILLITSFLFLVQCSLLRKDCANNLENLFNNTIDYSDNEIVEFVNDSGITKTDTVHIIYPSVEDTYINDDTDEDYRSCSDFFEVKLGEYEIQGSQSSNLYNNAFGVIINFYHREIYINAELDTVDYIYNDTAIKSFYRKWSITEGLPENEKYCSEIYFAVSDLRLLRYSVIENNVQTNWRLK